MDKLKAWKAILIAHWSIRWIFDKLLMIKFAVISELRLSSSHTMNIYWYYCLVLGDIVSCITFHGFEKNPLSLTKLNFYLGFQLQCGIFSAFTLSSLTGIPPINVWHFSPVMPWPIDLITSQICTAISLVGANTRTYIIKGFVQSTTAVSMQHCDAIFARSFLQCHFCNVILICRIILIFRFGQNHRHRTHSCPCRQQ